TQEKLPMSTNTSVSPLRQRMIEDMRARNLGPHSQRSHIHSCRRFAAFLKRSPDTATADDVRRFQLYLVESGLSIGNRNRIMTGVKFLFRVTLRRHDLAAEIYHLKEPEKLPLTMSPNEAERLLSMAGSVRDQVMLSLGYGCGLRAGEIVRLKDGDIDSAEMIIRIAYSRRGARTGTLCCRQSCLCRCGSGGRYVRNAVTRACPQGSVGYFLAVGKVSILLTA